MNALTTNERGAIALPEADHPADHPADYPDDSDCNAVDASGTYEG